ncbi:hypothetical protein IM774_04940 [Erysipelotrichaceae bacterium RD49]|nr:hypothetical protein [Erysipelotrichaceae bacterium RD49]
MIKPEIICYMMTSIDGRIDCNMTAQLPGVEDYYPLLDEFNFDATVSGRHTAELEMAEQGKFEPKTDRKAGKEVYVNYAEGQKQLDVIAATHGGLLWKKRKRVRESNGHCDQ